MSLFAFLPNLGGPDLIIILLIILVLFGAKKLPELARGMGSAIKEFQKAKDEFSDELHSAGKPTRPRQQMCKLRLRQSHESRTSWPLPLSDAGGDQTRAPNPDRTDRI